MRCEPAEPKLVDAIIGLMLQEIYTTYSSWRVDEIRIAIRAGACSQLGPMYRLSPAEFIRIMEVYHSCPLRLEALRQIRREKEKPKPVSSAASFYEQWKKDHPTPPATPKGKSVIEHSGQLVFDF